MPNIEPERRGPRGRTLGCVAVASGALVLGACYTVTPPEPPPVRRAAAPVARPVLSDHLLVTWYGNPRTPRMGVLGRHKGRELADALRKQAAEYASLSSKKILPAYHLVAVIAQANAWRDGTWRRRETHDTIRSLLDEARANNFKLILDIQRGHSTNRAELEYLRPYLEEPDVYLALDPEFAMHDGEKPGRKIGRMDAAEVNEAIEFLDAIVRRHQLPPKVLIVHQFTINMLGNKERIRDRPTVDVVLDVDGFGDRPLKRAMYLTIMRKPLEFAGIKLFYNEDTNLMTAQEVMRLQPEPAVVIYQ